MQFPLISIPIDKKKPDYGDQIKNFFLKFMEFVHRWQHFLQWHTISLFVDKFQNWLSRNSAPSVIFSRFSLKACVILCTVHCVFHYHIYIHVQCSFRLLIPYVELIFEKLHPLHILLFVVRCSLFARFIHRHSWLI